MLFICALAADIHPVSPPLNQWRDISMKLFLRDISPGGLQYISKCGLPLEDLWNFCNDWRGITCHEDQIQTIRYSSLAHGNFNINALPHSTYFIEITKCRQTFRLQTRLLPRKLGRINLSSNQICGNIDLTTLPSGLFEGLFESNRLTGPIEMTHLPRGLIELNLANNRLHHEVVWYDDIPESVARICLTSKKDTNTITMVVPSHPQYDLKDKSIFMVSDRKKIF